MDDTAHIDARRLALRRPRPLRRPQRIVADLEAAGPARRRQRPHPRHRPSAQRYRSRHRAAPLHAVVPRRQQDARQRRRLHRRPNAIAAVDDRAHPVHPRHVREDLPRVDEQHPRLVHLPPALVGPPHPRLALRRLPRDHRLPRHPHRLRHTAASPTSPRRPTSSTPGSPPACFPSPSSAGRRTANGTLTPDLAAFYPTAAPRHRLRHPLLLGRPHDHARLPLHARRPHARRHPRARSPKPSPSARSTSTPWSATPTARRCPRPRATSSTPSRSSSNYGTDAVRFTLASRPRPAPTSPSTKPAPKATAPSPTRSGTPPASSS